MSHFVVDFKKGDLANFPGVYLPLKAKFLKTDPELGRDPAVVFKDAEEKIEVAYCYKDLLNRHPEFKTNLLKEVAEKLLKRPVGVPESDFGNAFGTPEGKKAIKDQLLTAREELRKEAYQDAPPLPPPNPDTDDKANLKTLVTASPKGLCFGGKHNDKNRDGLVQDMLAQPDHGGLDMFFIEELGVIDQKEVDTFITAGRAGKMSKYLAAKVKAYPGVIKILEFARDYNDGKADKDHVKVFGIDAGEAVQPDGLLSLEGRAAGMNDVTRKVMKDATAKYPGKKFLAYCGAAHSNTHPGGVPGLSQMFGVPAIRISDASPYRIALDPEDKSLRGMPTAEEVEVIERLSAKEQPLVGQNKDRHQKVLELTDRARVETCKKAVTKLKPFRAQLTAEEKTQDELKKGGVATTTELEEAQKKVDEVKTQILLAEAEAKRVVKEYTTKYPGIVGVRDEEYGSLAETAKANGLDDLHDELAEADETKFVGELDARAEKQADEELKKLPTFGTMLPDAKRVKRGELLAQARFAEAKNAILGPYIAVRNELVETEKAFSKTKAEGKATPELMRKHTEKLAALDLKLEALRSDAAKRIPAYIEEHPELLDLKDGKDEMTLLHCAAVQGNGEMIDAIAKAKPGLVDQKDKKGNAAAHYVLERRDFLDDGLRASQLKAQAGGLGKLLANGANPNLKNAEEKTPLHLAALTGNGVAAGALLDGGADHTLTDKRKWTAFDTCLGSTKPAVEQVFYDKGKASPKYVPAKDPQSVVDILMQVTKCEKEGDAAGIREMYNKLYADENLRPILETAAVDAMQDREPPKEGGVRIFIADAEATGRLYASPAWYPGGEGGYDENANSFLLAGVQNPTKEARQGVLIHEMTHMVTRKMYGADTVPYGTDEDKDKYKQAIANDVRQMHLMNSSDPAEARIKDRMSDRLALYANRGGDDQLLQEYIVGVPQLIAECGVAAVKKYAPSLLKYYQEFTAKCQVKMKTDIKYTALHAKIDNSELDRQLTATPPVLPTSSDGWMDNNSADLSVDALMKKIKAEWTMRHGVAELPLGVTIAYSASVYKVKPEDQEEFNKKMTRIKAALEASLGEDGVGLAEKVESNGIRSLVLDVVSLAGSVGTDQLQEAVTGRSTNWVRDTKVRFVDHQIETGTIPDAKKFVEATLIHSESRALIKLGNTDPNAVADVNPEKQRDLIDALSKDLDKRIKNGLTVDKFSGLMNQLSTAIVNSPKAPFSIKQKNVTTDPTHLSVDKKDLKNAWLKKLKTLTPGR